MNEKYISLKKREFEELQKSEVEIKNSLANPNCFDGNYQKYYLFNNKWYQEYKKYLVDLLSGKTNKEYKYDVKSLKTDNEEKIFCFINDTDSFNFLTNFVVVNKNFVNLLINNFDSEEEIKVILSRNWDIIMGSQCIIRRDKNNPTINYITFFEEKKENKIDFYLDIDDKEEMEKHINLILNNNLWFYLGLINFNHKDEEKEIFDDKGNKIGIIICNCEPERSKLLESMKIKNIINDSNYQQSKDKKLINIEKIPKINSILVCLYLFNEFKNELFVYSQDINNKNAKLFADFFKIFDLKSPDDEIKSISGLIFPTTKLSGSRPGAMS